MSLLLLSILKKKPSTENRESSIRDYQDQQMVLIKRNRLWLMTYIALFTSLLAFFVLMITMVELEGSTPKRNYQKLINSLYQETVYVAGQQRLDWLRIENTLTKGVRISFPSNLIQNTSLFGSARAKINPRYLPYLQTVAEMIKALDLKGFITRHSHLANGVVQSNEKIQFIIRIEGHTDASPLAATARFRNNVELSTFRAYAMMEWLRIHTGLPRSFFSIAGYGSFHPIMEDTLAAENRRIEIYLAPKVSKAIKQSHQTEGLI